MQKVNVAADIVVEKYVFLPSIDDNLDGLFLSPKEFEGGCPIRGFIGRVREHVVTEVQEVRVVFNTDSVR